MRVYQLVLRKTQFHPSSHFSSHIAKPFDKGKKRAGFDDDSDDDLFNDGTATTPTPSPSKKTRADRDGYVHVGGFA